MTSHQPLGDVPPWLSSDHTMIVKQLTGYLFDKSTASPLLQIFNLWVYLYYMQQLSDALITSNLQS